MSGRDLSGEGSVWVTVSGTPLPLARPALTS
ncbi:MAG: hypothetical protein JWP64_4225 [Pseudonocardia sp.]|jgi:hypothetical protein|nr:hypothetical protein [Pseudonocardia sp.]